MSTRASVKARPARIDTADIEVKPLTPRRFPDLEAVFNAKGCSVARGCWCLYYRVSGEAWELGGRSLAEARHRELERRVDGGEFIGLVGYCGGVPVGWISLGPREAYRKLEKSPVMKPVDDARVWSIVCFVVPTEHRRQGVASALLRGAIAHARKKKVRILEAYPVDRTTRGSDDSMWFGAKSMYDAAGFVEVARRKPTRPVVRLHLSRSVTRGGRDG